MNLRHQFTSRFALSALAASAALAVGGGVALDRAPTASAQTVNAQEATSENWAGYIADSNVGNQQFSSVSGSWVEPTASSNSSTGEGQGYSAFWIGLGGSSDQSQALEQVGTSADTANGQTTYYAWYELVPSPETKLNLAVHPGDHISAKVSVSGSSVTISLTDSTTGQSVTKNLQMSNPDTSSAEWIAEAPSTEGGGGYQTLPLADFGKVTFTSASATSNGHTGTISDPDWSLQQVNLASANGAGSWAGGGAGMAGLGTDVSDQSSAGAQTSSLSSNGSSFSVSWAANGPSVASDGGTTGTTGTSTGSGDPYADGGGYGYSAGSGYGDGGGYGYGYGYGGGGYYGYGGGGYGYSGGYGLAGLAGGYGI